MDLGSPSLLFSRWHPCRFRLHRRCRATIPRGSRTHTCRSVDGADRRFYLSRTLDRRPRAALSVLEHVASVQTSVAHVDGRLDTSRFLRLHLSRGSQPRIDFAWFHKSALDRSPLDWRVNGRNHRIASGQLYGRADWRNRNSGVVAESRNTSSSLLDLWPREFVG